MPSLDNSFFPFDDYPGFSGMAPCMRSCDHTISYNGCDKAACWCNKGNLDLRMSSINRCASTECTFANMNTITDVTMLSGIQVQYCVDKNASPPGMALPSSVDAVPTGTTDTFATGTGTAKTGTKAVSGPSATNDPSSFDPLGPTPNPSFSQPSQPSASTSSSSNFGSSVLSTAAKTGIGIGAFACVLLAILIILLLVRRRKQPPAYYPPPPSYQGGVPPPDMTPTPYSNNGPFSPPPLQQPIPVHANHNQQQAYAMSNMGDVSPVSEKAVPVSTTPRVLRKEVGGKTKSQTEVSISTPPTTPKPTPHQPVVNQNAYPHAADGPREVHGDIPPPRHEVSNDGQITNTMSARGMELDGQGQYLGPQQHQQQQHQPYNYQQSPQGYPQYANAQEVDGGQNGWGQRQELPGQGHHGGQGGWGRQELPGNQGQGGGQYGQYGQAYEMPGR